MVRSLLRAGFGVTSCVYHKRDAMERLAREGVTEVPTPATLARACDVVVTCVPDAPQVEEVLFSDEGVAAGASRGSLVIDMSTISPIASKRFAQRLEERDVRFVDAPVSGGPARAADGTLTIMVGGDAKDVARAEPVLRAMGTPTHLGPVGMGETVKLTNQAIIANVMLANAEALVLAKQLGADLERVREVLLTATSANYLLEKWLPQTWFAGTFAGGFALDLLRKDLAAALESARAIRFAMPATGLAYQLYTNASAEGDGALDYSAIVRQYDRDGDKDNAR